MLGTESNVALNLSHAYFVHTFSTHRGSTGIFRRIKTDTSSGQRNLPVLLRFRRVIFTAETQWIHRH